MMCFLYLTAAKGTIHQLLHEKSIKNLRCVVQSVSAHHSQSHTIYLILHNRRFQETVFPSKKSAYSFLRSTLCILKVLGDVFEKAIICLRSSLNAPSATSCTLIGPMLPLMRKDL